MLWFIAVLGIVHVYSPIKRRDIRRVTEDALDTSFSYAEVADEVLPRLDKKFIVGSLDMQGYSLE